MRPLVLWLFVLGGVASAQPAPAKPIATTGRVINALGRPIVNATVSIEGMPDIAPVSTDKVGRFRITAPLGSVIVAAAPGYSTGIGALGGASIDDLVLLTEKQASETIEVTGLAPIEAPGAANLDRTEIRRVPGTGGDLVRTLTVMPGVVNFPFPTAYNGVVIRGAAPEDSKFLIDGFEVPSLYHNIGFRSILASEAIEKMDYIPGGFGVEYGRAASGIVALTTRPGSDESSEQAELSVIDGGLLAQGRSGRVRYMASLRRSVIDLLLPALIPPDLDFSLTTVPRYYDGQFRVDYALSPAWKLSASMFGSDDVLELFLDKAENPDKRFYSRTRFARLILGAKYHDGPWTAGFGVSPMPLEFVFERGLHQFIDVKQIEIDTRAEITRTAKDVAGLTDVVWKIGEATNVSRFDVSLALPPQPREGQAMGGFPDANDTSNKFHGVSWTPDIGLWTALSAGLSPDIRATVGVRVDAFTRSGDVATQPRGELQIKLAPHTTTRLSAGAYRRPAENQEELQHPDLHPERAAQVIAGIEHELDGGVRFQGSTYYTDRSDLIIRDGMGVLGNTGRGTTYGSELLGTMRDGPWFLWLSASLSHSVRHDTPTSGERLFEFDQPVNINAAASWKRGKWQLGGRFQLYSGLPLTPIVGSVFDSDGNTYTPLFGKVYSERAPVHHQLDLRIDRYWTWGPVDLDLFLDVQNVYINQSVVGYFYSYDFTQRSAFKSLPIIPSIGIRGQL